MIRSFMRLRRAAGKPLGLFCGVVGILAGVALVPAAAAPAPRSELSETLDMLRQRGYADFAAEYLTVRKDDPALPADVRETWDVEMANSLWIASTQTNNEKESERRRTLAQGHLESFQKEHPKHPAVAEVMVTWATTALDDGAKRIQLAKLSTGEAEKEIHIGVAKKLLADAGQRLTKALETFEAQLKELNPAVAAAPAPNPGDDNRVKPAAEEAPKLSPEQEKVADLKFRVDVVRFQLALVDYWLAQTYGEAQAAEKAAKLKSSSDVFAKVHRANRTEFLGLISHYWTARVMSDTNVANNEEVNMEVLEMLDEVLTVAPDKIEKGSIDGATLSLVGDCLVLRIQLMVKSKQEEMAAGEAYTWLKANSIWQDTPAFQGIAIEWVKIISPNLDKLRGDPKQKAAIQKDISLWLNRMSRGRGPYQREAASLLAKLAKQAGNVAAGSTFEEALTAADSAYLAGQWAAAVGNYKKARELLEGKPFKGSAGDKAKHEKHIAERLPAAEVQIAYGLARDNQLPAATEIAERIIREYPKSAAAPTAATLALQTLQVMANDPKKNKAEQEPLLKRWEELAETTLKTWPHNPEADEARFVLGHFALQRNDGRAAVDRLTSISPNSPRYSPAMVSAARFAWRKHQEEMAKPEAQRKPAQVQLFRESALKWLTAGIDAQHPLGDDAKPEDRDKDRQQRAQLKLLLADIQTACGKPADAQATYESLFSAGLEANSGKIDDITMRAITASFKAVLARSDFDKASEMAVELSKRAGNQPQINALVINVLKFLVADLRKAQGAVTDTEGGNDEAAAKKAAEGLAAARKRTASLLAVLIKQDQQSALTMVFIGDNFLRVGMNSEGQVVYERILERAAKDEAFAKEAGPTIIRVRAALIGMLSDKKEYAKALKQIDLLLIDHPNALDVIIQRGKILQAWSKVEPAQLEEAIRQWNSVSKMLAGMKPRLPEYYDAIYNTAECLVIKSQREKTPDSASVAEQLLSGTLVREPQLNGPDTVAKYKALIKRAAALRAKK